MSLFSEVLQGLGWIKETEEEAEMGELEEGGESRQDRGSRTCNSRVVYY